MKAVGRRRPRTDEENAKFRDFSYEYKVRFIQAGVPFEARVCHKAFIALFGITNRRIQTIKSALLKTGKLHFICYKSMCRKGCEIMLRLLVYFFFKLYLKTKIM